MEIKKGRYQHYKGNIYEVLGVAKQTETESELVVYRDSVHNLWARPKDNFSALVKVNDKEVPRFRYLG